MNSANYISLDLARKLKENGCELESDYVFIDGELHETHPQNGEQVYLQSISDNEKGNDHKIYFCYDILNDICCRYAVEFFGEPQKITDDSECWSENGRTWLGSKFSICLHCNTSVAYQPHPSTGCNHAHYPEACEHCQRKTLGWREHTKKVFELIQDGKKQDAEKYIFDNCIFNPLNHA